MGCEKISNDDNGTLYGSWTVREYSMNSNIRTYLTSIVKEPVDESIVVINNFYNLGQDFQVYCRLKDSTLTIFQTNGQIPEYTFTGTGIYHKSARKVSWQYVVTSNSGSTEYVQADYVKN